MKSFYSVSIPKPCHENWDAMTPNEKGRFCNACAKTVIDFTKMTTIEIQEILHENRNNRICGRLRQDQLDAINLKIPIDNISSETNFHRLFLLILLIVMGTSFFNCTDSNNKVRKIDNVEVVDSIKIKTGNIRKDNNPPIVSDTLDIQGEIIQVMGLMLPEIGNNAPAPFHTVTYPAEFKGTPKHLSSEEKKEYFKEKMTKFIIDNFAGPNICFEQHGVHRIYSEFVIDSLGIVGDINVRTSYKPFEKEIIRTLKLLPQFIPAKQDGKNVSMVYNLPIIFKVEE